MYKYESYNRLDRRNNNNDKISFHPVIFIDFPKEVELMLKIRTYTVSTVANILFSLINDFIILCKK